MKLTDNFTLEELTYSNTAKSRGIDNTPNATAIKNLKTLCEKILQPTREWYGKPIHINSGYRCKALNKAVGGATNSNHLYGYAVDLVGYDHTMKESKKIFDYIKTHFVVSELLWEHNKYGSYWVHVAFNTYNLKNKVNDNFYQK